MAARTKTRGWRRLLEGWGAGVLVLLIAGSSIVLGLPQAVAPERIPRPAIDSAALAATMAQDEALAREAVDEPLDVDVRAVGRELRAYNRAAASADERELARARGRLVEAARKALRHGDRPLLALRAYQMLRFLEELGRWEASGEVSDELAALGGDFVATVGRNAWCRGGPRQLVLDERELRTLFKKRWNDVIGIEGPAFELTLDEDRVRYGFLIAHPFRPTVGRGGSPALDQTLDQRQRLRLIERLSERDPSYPADFARGVVNYQMGRYPAASEAFRRHLAAHSDGPYTLRAQNHLKAALDHTR